MGLKSTKPYHKILFHILSRCKNKMPLDDMEHIQYGFLWQDFSIYKKIQNSHHYGFFNCHYLCNLIFSVLQQVVASTFLYTSVVSEPHLFPPPAANKGRLEFRMIIMQDEARYCSKLHQITQEQKRTNVLEL